MGTLSEANQMPLVLATAQQMLKCPQSWGVPESPTSQDVMGKIIHLEKALSDSIELQKNQMNSIKEEIVIMKNSVPRPTQIPVVTLNQDTPNTKKSKLEQGIVSQAPEQVQQHHYDLHQHQQPQQHQPHLQQQLQHQQQQSYASIAGISPLGRGLGRQQHQGLRVIQNILQKSQQLSGQNNRNLCIGSAKENTAGGDDTRLSGDVSLVA